MTQRVSLVILGEPASKANSREMATIGAKTAHVIEGDDIVKKRVGGRTIFRKSDKAIAYEREALRQIPPACRVQFSGPVRVTIRIYYATERPDLDESIVLDVLQDRYKTLHLPKGEKRRELVQKGVYANDRQVREKHVFHAIDKRNPRAEIVVEALEQQARTEPLFEAESANA